jgi:hypothetical protein
MEPIYYCPICNKSITVGNDIILIAKTDHHGQGIVFLHVELGNYESSYSSDFKPKSGELTHFHCPICHADLSLTENSNLAAFDRIDEDGRQASIIISQVFGEECTYKVEDQKVTMSYGQHISKYTNPEWYLG